MRRADMLLNAYQPIARGKVFSSKLLTELGAKYGKSAGQIALRWHVQQDHVGAIPRSAKAENIRSNMDIFDFELSSEDMAAIHALARGERYSRFEWEPDWD
ncbi:MAG: aldo/keto reductase [Oxalobacteraceae bacterium]|nr:MAG: aldo/keto reductase [Oxalobacteraceae bacterium]